MLQESGKIAMGYPGCGFTLERFVANSDGDEAGYLRIQTRHRQAALPQQFLFRANRLDRRIDHCRPRYRAGLGTRGNPVFGQTEKNDPQRHAYLRSGQPYSRDSLQRIAHVLNKRPNFGRPRILDWIGNRSEEHTSELQSLMRISYAGFR